jgi:hypothetical protein
VATNTVAKEDSTVSQVPAGLLSCQGKQKSKLSWPVTLNSKWQILLLSLFNLLLSASFLAVLFL